MPGLLQGRLGIAVMTGWSDWLRLPDFLSRDQSVWLNFSATLLLAVANLALIFAYYRFYYRGLPVQRERDGFLVIASLLATVFVYQSGTWLLLSVLLITLLGYTRVRTVIQSRREIMFLIWGVASGLLIGSGYPLPVLLINAAVCLTGLILVNRRSAMMRYLLIIRYSPAIQDQLLTYLQPLKGKIISHLEHDGMVDLTLEVRLRYVSLALVDHLAAMKGVLKAVMVSDDKPDSA
jgi:hypothetical protein